MYLLVHDFVVTIELGQPINLPARSIEIVLPLLLFKGVLQKLLQWHRVLHPLNYAHPVYKKIT